MILSSWDIKDHTLFIERNGVFPGESCPISLSSFIVNHFGPKQVETRLSGWVPLYVIKVFEIGGLGF
jgi:hypothetical protein